MESNNEWLPAIVAIAIGLCFAVGIILKLERRRREGEELYSLVDLEERYNHAIALLRDLELYKDRLEPDSYEVQRARLELEAAAAMRSRDKKLAEEDSARNQASGGGGQSSKEETTSEVVGFMGRYPQLQGFVWGLGLAVVVGGLYASVQKESRPRPPSQGARPMAGPASGEANSKMAELLDTLQKDPTNVEAMVELARLLLRAQMLNEASLVTERALQFEPENLGALTYAAVIKSGRGDGEGGFLGLEDVLGKDPTFHQAWFFKGMLSMQAGNTEQMKESFGKFIEFAPDSPRKERIKKMLAGGGIQMPPMNR